MFRFSALTYNGHRIHYDREYATTVEGYPGLVVHGPLQALAMAEAARRCEPSILDRPLHFSYRLTAPLFDYQGMVAAAESSEDTGDIVTRVHDPGGRTTASGSLGRLATESTRS